MKKGLKLKVECESLSFEGMGICKVNSVIIFVENLLPGEEAEIEITEVSKNFANARVISYLSTTSERIVPKCTLYDHCGGCNISHMSNKLKHEVKIGGIKNLLRKKSLDIEVIDKISNEDAYGYRNKVVMHVEEVDNQIISGPYIKGTNNVVGSHCLMLSDIGNEIHQSILEKLNRFNISVFNTKTKTGTLKNITYRRNENQEFMVIFVVCKMDDNLEKLISELENTENVVSIYINVVDKSSRNIIGKEDIHCYGEKFLESSIGHVKYLLSPQSFFQINNQTTLEMYQKLTSLAEFSKDENVLDAYCGLGSITLFINEYVNSVVGVDISSSSIDDARLNSKTTNNVSFIQGDIAKVVENLPIKFDVIITDPPRKGCSSEFLDFIIKNNFSKIIYMSCNPATLIRDIEYLNNNGYEASKIYAYDMFAHTSHVETLVALKKQG